MLSIFQSMITRFRPNIIQQGIEEIVKHLEQNTWLNEDFEKVSNYYGILSKIIS